MALYGLAVAFVLGYFAEIDYYAEIIKSLFLVKRTDVEFYNEYIHNGETGKKQNCWDKLCSFKE